VKKLSAEVVAKFGGAPGILADLSGKNENEYKCFKGL
jgi:hypothetical protein